MSAGIIGGYLRSRVEYEDPQRTKSRPAKQSDRGVLVVLHLTFTRFGPPFSRIDPGVNQTPQEGGCRSDLPYDGVQLDRWSADSPHQPACRAQPRPDSSTNGHTDTRQPRLGSLRTATLRTGGRTRARSSRPKSTAHAVPTSRPQLAPKAEGKKHPRPWRPQSPTPPNRREIRRKQVHPLSRPRREPLRGTDRDSRPRRSPERQRPQKSAAQPGLSQGQRTRPLPQMRSCSRGLSRSCQTTSRCPARSGQSNSSGSLRRMRTALRSGRRAGRR